MAHAILQVKDGQLRGRLYPLGQPGQSSCLLLASAPPVDFEGVMAAAEGSLHEHHRAVSLNHVIVFSFSSQFLVGSA